MHWHYKNNIAEKRLGKQRLSAHLALGWVAREEAWLGGAIDRSGGRIAAPFRCPAPCPVPAPLGRRAASRAGPGAAAGRLGAPPRLAARARSNSPGSARALVGTSTVFTCVKQCSVKLMSNILH